MNETFTFRTASVKKNWRKLIEFEKFYVQKKINVRSVASINVAFNGPLKNDVEAIIREQNKWPFEERRTWKPRNWLASNLIEQYLFLKSV